MPESCSISGLLHDIGMVVMQQHHTRTYEKALMKVSMNDRPFYSTEKDLFGLSHSDIGGYLLEWWGLPYPIVECSYYHHDPLASSTNRKLVCAVHLADYYAWTCLGRRDIASLDTRVFDIIGIAQPKCEEELDEAMHSWDTELFNLTCRYVDSGNGTIDKAFASS